MWARILSVLYCSKVSTTNNNYYCDGFGKTRPVIKLSSSAMHKNRKVFLRIPPSIRHFGKWFEHYTFSFQL